MSEDKVPYLASMKGSQGNDAPLVICRAVLRILVAVAVAVWAAGALRGDPSRLPYQSLAVALAAVAAFWAVERIGR